MTRFKAPAFVILCVLFARSGGVGAHHSLSGYSDEVSEMEGDLVGIQWRNPHIRMDLRVVNDRGEPEVWSMDANSIYNLHRAGVARELFNIGDHVRVAGNKSRRGDLDFRLTNMLFADGREVLLWGGVGPRWMDSYIGGRDLLAANAPLEGAATDQRGIFRVWTVPQNRERVTSTHLPFTAQAIAARKNWDVFDNFATRCEPEGMPRIMINPHPFEFIDRGDRITLRTELYDIERTIHMDRSAPPDDEPWSRLGYSVGRWQDGSLVVRTTRVNWAYFDNIGTPQSESVEIIERFTLNERSNRLDFQFAITDPGTFSEPATIQSHWLALGDTIEKYNCEADKPK
jgi:hypothetical protein